MKKEHKEIIEKIINILEKIKTPEFDLFEVDQAEVMDYKHIKGAIDHLKTSIR